MDVDLTSGSKHLIVQPPHVEVDGAIPTINPAASSFLFAPVRLVRWVLFEPANAFGRTLPADTVVSPSTMKRTVKPQ